jgi:hypothetical protein
MRRELPLGGQSLQYLELADQRALVDRLERSYLVVQGPLALARHIAVLA